MTSADFNGDMNPDLAVANRDDNTVSILLGTSTGSFGVKTDFPTGAYPFAVITSDFNGDGKADLAVANRFSDSVSILLGTGTGTFGGKTDFGVGGEPLDLTSADFNGDLKPDLAVANDADNSVSILLGTGTTGTTGSFGAKTDLTFTRRVSGVTSADFNADNRPDLAVTLFKNSRFNSESKVAVLLGQSNGTFGPEKEFNTGTAPRAPISDDFNGDGKADLAVATYFGPNGVSVLFGQGNGSFGASKGYTANGQYPVSLVSGDFDGFGKPDLAVLYLNGAIGIHRNKGNGTFPDTWRRQFSAGTGFSYGTWLTTADFNGDGKLDLAASVRGTSSRVAVLLADRSPSPKLKVNINGASTIKKGNNNKYGIYKVKVKNVGNATATGVKAKLQINGNATLNGGSSTKQLGQIVPGKTRAYALKILFKQLGKVKLSIKATSANAGTKIAKKKVTVVKK